MRSNSKQRRTQSKNKRSLHLLKWKQLHLCWFLSASIRCCTWTFHRSCPSTYSSINSKLTISCLESFYRNFTSFTWQHVLNRVRHCIPHCSQELTGYRPQELDCFWIHDDGNNQYNNYRRWPLLALQYLPTSQMSTSGSFSFVLCLLEASKALQTHSLEHQVSF